MGVCDLGKSVGLYPFIGLFGYPGLNSYNFSHRLNVRFLPASLFLILMSLPLLSVINFERCFYLLHLTRLKLKFSLLSLFEFAFSMNFTVRKILLYQRLHYSHWCKFYTSLICYHILGKFLLSLCHQVLLLEFCLHMHKAYSQILLYGTDLVFYSSTTDMV